MMVYDWVAAILMIAGWAHGFMTAWALCHDGKCGFWTGYLDVTTLRILWR